MAEYLNSSPYAETKVYKFYLDVASLPGLEQDGSEFEAPIDAKYHHRPDLLAYEAYGSSRLWWVFAALNPDVIKDPIFDFTSGTTIKLLSKERAQALL